MSWERVYRPCVLGEGIQAVCLGGGYTGRVSWGREKEEGLEKRVLSGKTSLIPDRFPHAYENTSLVLFLFAFNLLTTL